MRVRNHATETGSYTLSLAKFPSSTILTLVPPLEGDACKTQVTACSIHGTIESAGQVDWYGFDADAGDKLFIELVEGDGMEYMIIDLIDSQGESLSTANSASYSVKATIDTKLETGGTYFMRVRNNATATGSYTLSFMKAPF